MKERFNCFYRLRDTNDEWKLMADCCLNVTLVKARRIVDTRNANKSYVDYEYKYEKVE